MPKKEAVQVNLYRLTTVFFVHTPTHYKLTEPSGLVKPYHQ